MILEILIVTAIAASTLYLIHSLAAGRFVSFDAYQLLISMSTSFLVMTIMEAALGRLHEFVFGWPLWGYRIAPIYGGHGSALAPITWPWYGFHFYLLDQVARLRGFKVNSSICRGAISALDGPLLEAFANGLFVFLFGTHIFYYEPGEFGHLTSVFVVPYWGVAGIALALVMRAMRHAKEDWLLPAALIVLALGVVFLGMV